MRKYPTEIRQFCKTRGEVSSLARSNRLLSENSAHFDFQLSFPVFVCIFAEDNLEKPDSSVFSGIMVRKKSHTY
jgi:hypothetical protein